MNISASLIGIPLLLLLSNCGSTGKDDFVSIFNGTTLSGWYAVPEDCWKDWSVQNGAIVGERSKNRLAYLVYNNTTLEDFVLIRITNGTT